MTLPPAPLLQTAYVVRSIAEAAEHWHRTLGVGPFYTGNNAAMPPATYRGQASTATFDYALAYNGDIQIELVQLTNDAPSLFREMPTPEGFHHILPQVPDFDRALAAYAAADAPVVHATTMIDGSRVVFVDGRRHLGSFIELVETTPSFLKRQARFKQLYQEVGMAGELVLPFSALRRK